MRSEHERRHDEAAAREWLRQTLQFEALLERLRAERHGAGAQRRDVQAGEAAAA